MINSLANLTFAVDRKASSPRRCEHGGHGTSGSSQGRLRLPALDVRQVRTLSLKLQQTAIILYTADMSSIIMAADLRGASSDLFEKVKATLVKWPGVTSQPHRFGGIEFRVDGREMGHIHGSSLADFPFPTSIRNQLVESRRVSPHHVLPSSGWVSYWISSDSDFMPLIDLFKLQYERLSKTKSNPQE